jgi:iron(III) transport system permease protein
MTTRLSPLPGLLAVAATVTPILIGFGFPFIYLIRAAFTRIEVHGVDASMIAAFKTTVLFSAAATLVAVAAGVTVAYAIRRMRAQLGRIVLAAGSIGYATPGTVVGIAILPVITGADRLIDRAAGMVYGGSTGLLLLGSGAAVIYAYVVRFLAVPLGGAESAFAKVPPSLDDAAAMLGASPRERLMDVHMPLIRRAVIASGVLMFVDCVKELPATLLLRPLGVETLATVLYGEAARGTYESGAVAALLIVSISVLPVWLLSSLVRDERTGPSVLS